VLFYLIFLITFNPFCNPKINWNFNFEDVAGSLNTDEKEKLAKMGSENSPRARHSGPHL
jgi:hypothetical protein